MKRPLIIVLVLALLIALAFLLHRGARVQWPVPPPPPPREADPEPPPAPPTVVSAPQPPRVPPPPPPPPPLMIPPAPLQETVKGGSVRGTVKLNGIRPPRRTIKSMAEPRCAALHPSGLLRDDIVIDPENNVRWAFVYVAEGNVGPAKGLLPPVLLDQVGCRFEPHVLGLRVGQPLNIWNNDPLLHNVHAEPEDNRAFNFGLPTLGLFETKTFLKREVMIPIRCDIHPWMQAWVGVLDHPYFSVTSDTGGYGIVDLPPGRFLIKVWHEAFAGVEREVEVQPGADVRLDFVLDARK
ncbi:MAG: hypothetical protein HY293_07790 [Planctomycetes bacterium]|nr:hypothetical protein [Planctomycetota bacterium]